MADSNNTKPMCLATISKLRLQHRNLSGFSDDQKLTEYHTIHKKTLNQILERFGLDAISDLIEIIRNPGSWQLYVYANLILAIYASDLMDAGRLNYYERNEIFTVVDSINMDDYSGDIREAISKSMQYVLILLKHSSAQSFLDKMQSMYDLSENDIKWECLNSCLFIIASN